MADAQASTTRRQFQYGPELAPGLIRVIEVALILVAGVAPSAFGEAPNPDYVSQYGACVMFTAVAYAMLSEWSGLNDVSAIMRPLAIAERVLIAAATCGFHLLALLYAFNISYQVSPQWLWMFFAAIAVGLMVNRFAVFHLLRTLSRRQIVGRNLAVLGAGTQAARLLRKIVRDPPYFTALVGVFTPSPAPHMHELETVPVLGSIDDLLATVRSGGIDDIVVAMPWSEDREVIKTIEHLKELPVSVYLGADLIGFELEFQPVVGAFSQMPVYRVVQCPISGWSSTLKAMLDYSVATTALVLLAPLLAMVAIAIKLDSPGPIIFMQDRLGFNNKRFAIYKFRSMRTDADTGHHVRQATRGDPRVTRIGRFIRATSIDELPQLFNVLNGTMSLVGPRPHALSHNEEYGRQIRGYFARHKVKPGITGWAQVKGLRGETADLDTMRRRVDHDVYYAENWSFLLDVKILFMTAALVLFQKNAY